MIEVLNKVAKQYQTWRSGVATKNILYHFQTRERRRSYGNENPDVIYYVIRSIRDKSPFYTGPVHNLMANYFYVLSHLQYAEERGWIPVVDQLNYPVYNSLPGKAGGRENAWEYFWEQPNGASLEEAYRSRHVVLSKQSWYGQWDMGYAKKNYVDKALVAQFHRLSDQVPLNQATKQKVQEAVASFLPNGEKTMGVSIRFGGHAKSCYYHGQGHPIQPELAALLELVERSAEKWEMEWIFLASDEENAVRRFQERLGSKLIVMPRVRSSGTERYDRTHPNPMYVEEQLMRTSLGYLIEMEILARCCALVGTVTSGLRYAVVRNGGRYEHLNIIDCGLFPDPRRRGNREAL